MDKDKVQDMLFAAFEKHQYYNVKDLVRITQQPIVSMEHNSQNVYIYMYYAADGPRIVSISLLGGITRVPNGLENHGKTGK